jgi:hypothetical protein
MVRTFMGVERISNALYARIVLRPLPAATVRTASNRGTQERSHSQTDDIALPAMRQRWEAHQRETRLDRYTDAAVAVIAVVTAAALVLGWLWIQG